MKNLAIAGLLVVGGLMLLNPQGCQLPNVPIISQQYPDAWLVVVEESSNRPKELAILLQDWTWRKSLDERGIQFRVLDADQPEAASYQKLNLQLPAIVFVRPNGQVVKIADLPKTDTKKNVEKLVLEVTGK